MSTLLFERKWLRCLLCILKGLILLEVILFLKLIRRTPVKNRQESGIYYTGASTQQHGDVISTSHDYTLGLITYWNVTPSDDTLLASSDVDASHPTALDSSSIVTMSTFRHATNSTELGYNRTGKKVKNFFYLKVNRTPTIPNYQLYNIAP